MPPLDRRAFLKSAAGAAALTATGTALAGPAFSAALQVPVDAVFQYGVASGDPLPNGVIIWTRVTPTPDATPGSGAGAPTPVQWVVAEDAELKQVVQRGQVTTSPDSDHTVKVDVAGLQPNRAYFYGFTALGSSTPVGSTRTAPAVGDSPALLRFGMVSCSNYTGGYFSAYRHLSDRNDLDFVVHLGDYIYEYGNGEDRYGPASLVGKRDHDPATEMVSLSDYRRRHALYKADPDLAGLHRKYAFITTWDDHEVTNDAFREGAENHEGEDDPDTEGTRPEGDYLGVRRNDGYQGYVEWMPIRLPVARTAEETRIYRRLRFGTLADLTMLDLRQYRDMQVSSTNGEAIDDPDRVMTGPEQQSFLEQGLSAPGSPSWRLFGNPVQIMQVKTPPLPAAAAAALALLQGAPGPDIPQSGFSLLVDPWDGYTANRQRVLDFALAEGVGDPVFLTGDIHSTWAADLPIDAGTYTGSPTPVSPSAGIEFVCTSVTSDNLDEITGSPPRTTSIALEEQIQAANRHIKEVELDSHGYSVVDLTAERIQFDTYFISNREDPESTQSFFRGFQSLKDSRTVTPAAQPIPMERPDRAATAPPPAGGGRDGGAPSGSGSGSGSTNASAGRSLAATGLDTALPALAGASILAGMLRWRGQRMQDAQDE